MSATVPPPPPPPMPSVQGTPLVDGLQDAPAAPAALMLPPPETIAPARIMTSPPPAPPLDRVRLLAWPAPPPPPMKSLSSALLMLRPVPPKPPDGLPERLLQPAN